MNCKSLFSLMQKEDVLKLAKEAVKEFPLPLEKPQFTFLTKRKFAFYLSESPLEMHLEYTPAFVAHLPEGELVCFCMDILKNFLQGDKEEKKKVIKAITIHELFHIYNKKRAKDGKEALRSEAAVHQEIKKYFKEYYALLEKHEDENKLNITRRVQPEFTVI